MCSEISWDIYFYHLDDAPAYSIVNIYFILPHKRLMLIGMAVGGMQIMDILLQNKVNECFFFLFFIFFFLFSIIIG